MFRTEQFQEAYLKFWNITYIYSFLEWLEVT